VIVVVIVICDCDFDCDCDYFPVEGSVYFVVSVTVPPLYVLIQHCRHGAC